MKGIIGYDGYIMKKPWYFGLLFLLIGCEPAELDKGLFQGLTDTNQWQYRWSETAPWKATAQPLNPPMRQGQKILWLKLKLPQYMSSDTPYLYIRGVDQAFEVYQHGHKIYGFGHFPDADEPFRFPGFKWHMIPIKDLSNTPEIEFKVYSEHTMIGLFGNPQLGTSSAHLIHMIQREGGKLAVGILLVFLSGLTLMLYTRQVNIFPILSLACFSLLTGIFVLARSETKQLFFDAPLLWRWVELSTLYFVPSTMLLFMRSIFEKWRNLLLYVALGQWVYALSALGLSILGFVPITATLWPVQFFLLLDLCLSVLLVSLCIKTKRQEALIFLGGFVTLTLPALHQLAMSRAWIHWGYESTHWGLLFFMVSLVMLLRGYLLNVYREKELAEFNIKQKDLFLASMSHELRTPLNAIIGFSNVLKKKLSHITVKEEEYLNRIYENGVHLLNIVNDILDISKLNTGHFDIQWESFHPETLIPELESHLSQLAQENNNEYCIENSLPQITINSDPARIKQIMINLISNACKFTQHGLITLRFSLDNTRRHLILEVEDTGIGIATSDLAKLFQDFSQVDPSIQRNYGGTGLGLSLSRKIAHQLKGHISVSSIEGQGSVFKVSLPL